MRQTSGVCVRASKSEIDDRVCEGMCVMCVRKHMRECVCICVCV